MGEIAAAELIAIGAGLAAALDQVEIFAAGLCAALDDAPGDSRDDIVELSHNQLAPSRSMSAMPADGPQVPAA